MPKFDDYTQKSTPEDTDLMLLLDKTENANKKVLFSGIWNWIVKKLAEAVIEKLQTSDKTIIGALNELNSKTILSAYAPSKPEDNDDISGINIWTASTRKYGRLVNIQFNVQGTIKTTGKFITLYTLNEGYRPITNVIHNYVTQNGTSMILSILPSGEVQVYAFEAITNDWIIRQCITFVCTL